MSTIRLEKNIIEADEFVYESTSNILVSESQLLLQGQFYRDNMATIRKLT